VAPLAAKGDSRSPGAAGGGGGGRGGSRLAAATGKGSVQL
jgi:hypothetical protein